MSIEDDMFRHTSGRSFTNPRDPFDPSTGSFTDRFSSYEFDEDTPSETIEGWSRFAIIAGIVGFIILAGTWHP